MVRKGKWARTWIVTGAYAVIATVASVLITSSLQPRISYGEPFAGDTSCGGYGIATSAAWWEKTDDELRESFELARSTGVCAVRLGVIWSEIEKSPGTYDWHQLDRQVLLAKETGVDPMLMLYSAPQWVFDSGSSEGTPFEDRASLFGTFAAEVARRYGADVDAYEIWNEPNVERFWENPNVDEYLALLRAAYPKIHSVDESATVITGGLAPAADEEGSIAPVTFVRTLYEGGGNQWFDALGMHPYTWREDVEARLQFRDLNEVESLMAQFGDEESKIWITEYGAPTGGLGGITQSEQSEVIRWGIDEAAADPRIAAIYLYDLHDYPLGLFNPESYFGLYTSSGQPKVVSSLLREERPLSER